MNKFFIVTYLLALFQISHAQDVKFGKVSKESLEAKQHPSYTDAHASVLYRMMHTSFDYTQDDGFIIETEVHERIKIYTQDGYDYATIQIPLYAGSSSEEEIMSLKAVSYNMKDGKIEESKLAKKNIFKEEISKNRKAIKFTMPDINDGTIIEYKYKFISPFIAQIDEYRFQEAIPVDKVDMRFLAPEYIVYRPYGKGSIPLDMKTEKKDRSVNYRYESASLAKANDVERGNATLKFIENGYSVNLTDIPPLTKEPYATNQENYMAGLQFELMMTKFPNSPVKNYATTWESVADKIYKSDQFGKELEQTRYFKKEIDALLTGVTEPSEKLFKVYEYVKSKLNWNEYYGVYTDLGVKKAFNEGVGNVADINLMLNTMLNYAGIEASPILLSTKSNGIPFFPTRTGFNYVVVGAKLDKGLLLLDGTDKNGVPNILKPELLNWKGRMIKKDGTSRLIDLYPNKQAVHNCMMTINLDDEDVVKGNSKNRYSNHYAKSQRQLYKTLTESKQKDILNNNYKELDVVDVTFKEMENAYKPLTMEYNFEIEDGVEEISGKKYITPLFHLVTNTNFFKAETRTSPIDFAYSQADKFIININIPAGYEVESLPEDLAINLAENMGLYRFNIKQTDSKITVSLQNSLNTPVIAAKYYKDLQAYYKLIFEKESEKIVLKKN